MAYPRLFAFLCGAVLASAVTSAGAKAADTSAVMAPVRQFVDGFNSGNAKMSVATCASPAYILDDFPPHVWQGPTACADWATAYAAASKKMGITGGKVTLGMPLHVDVSGNVAYVVVPTTFTYKQRGKMVTESGSMWTLSLQKSASGWRITAWAWAQH